MSMEKGDWVQVWGQVASVLNVDSTKTEVDVEFASHTEQWKGFVRSDRVVKPDTLPEFAARCSAMHDGGGDAYWRCTLHSGHAGDHRRMNSTWDDTKVAGYFEER